MKKLNKKDSKILEYIKNYIIKDIKECKDLKTLSTHLIGFSISVNIGLKATQKQSKNRI